MKLWRTPIYENVQIIIILDWMQILDHVMYE